MAIRFKYADKIPPWLRNKYVITILIFILWVLFFDANNLLDRWRGVRKYRSLETDREYYSKRIEEDRRKLEELRTDNESLEKFAREQYRMKKPEEDIYIIVSPDESRRIQKESSIR
ncbi:MAG: septum formation initiator family protein [Bacteroidales bacterium]|jgi:cell division protein FtsB|nr:septum formation initiator family protein [Bacteroidales bacterium]